MQAREEACRDLLAFLVQEKNDNGNSETLQENMHYTLKRLVKGLGPDPRLRMHVLCDRLCADK